MRKQGLFILLLLMSFCSMMRAQTSFTYGGLNYTVFSEADGTAIVGKQDASLSGDVIIGATAVDPSTDVKYTVVAVGDEAFSGCAGLTSLVIPAGVSSIGQNALANCTGLKWVVVKDGVSDIAVGADAFSGMPASTILYVPAGKRSEFVYDYNWQIFKSIIQDDNITFADSNVESVCVNNWDTNEDGELSQVEALMVTSLGQKFWRNTAIISFKELQYFRSLNTLNGDFYNCSNLVDIKFPNSIKNIGDRTFHGCNKLTLADGLPEYLENIGVYAFSGCNNLGDIYIPETVTSIDYRAFRESNPLSLTVDPDNTIYDSRNNCNAIIQKSDDGLLVGCSKTVIPEGVKYLNWYSFSGRKGLEYIVIPEGMEHVGNRTFLRTDLHSVTLPSTIKIIGENAFEGCGYLKEIVINTSDTVAIEKGAFPEGVDGMKIYAKKGFKANNLKPLTVGLGSWATQVMYDYIKVTELVSGRDKVIAEEHFNTDAMDKWEVHGGTWEISNGSLCQTSDSNDCMITLKNIELPAKYKYNIRAKRTGGFEGFLAVVNFENESNWQWWNVGGWQNTKHCLEYAPSGSENYIGDPVEGGIIVGDWNDIEIIVDNQYITCILNGDTVHKNVVNTKHNYWKNYTIYEHDESNVVSAKEAIGRNGGKIIVPVELKNEKEVYQFQCDVIVPEGISLDAIKASSIRANSHTAEMSKVEDNHYRITMINAQSVPFTGNSGELLKIVLNVSETILEGDYDLRLTDVILSDKNYVDINVPYCISNLSIDNSANVGDVNNDGKITVTDVMLLVDYILELNTVPITDIVADVNGDGKVTVTDVQLLVDIILEKNTSSAKIRMFQVREPE